MLVDFPHFIKSSDLDAANYNNCDKTSNHDHRLKHVCPHHSFQATLIRDTHRFSNLHNSQNRI